MTFGTLDGRCVWYLRERNWRVTGQGLWLLRKHLRKSGNQRGALGTHLRFKRFSKIKKKPMVTQSSCLEIKRIYPQSHPVKGGNCLRNELVRLIRFLRSLLLLFLLLFFFVVFFFFTSFPKCFFFLFLIHVLPSSYSKW